MNKCGTWNVLTTKKSMITDFHSHPGHTWAGMAKLVYEMWHLGLWNVPVKAVFNYVHTNSFHLWSCILALQNTYWVSVSTVQIIADSPLLECSLEWLLHGDQKMRACQEPSNARVWFSLSIWTWSENQQGYLCLFTGEDLKFGHMFGSCFKTVPLLRTCPLPPSKNANEMGVSRFGLVLLLAVSRTEDGLERPQNFRHQQHSRTCIEEHS